jgi:hypothetical protein
MQDGGASGVHGLRASIRSNRNAIILDRRSAWWSPRAVTWRPIRRPVAKTHFHSCRALDCDFQRQRTSIVTAVGRPVPIGDATLRVTGRLPFVGDMQPRGMLHGKILRSPHAHARIISINAHRAEWLAGVVAVLTGADIAGGAIEPFYGPIISDQPIVAIDRVRFAGEPVAAVVAVDIDNRTAISDQPGSRPVCRSFHWEPDKAVRWQLDALGSRGGQTGIDRRVGQKGLLRSWSMIWRPLLPARRISRALWRRAAHRVPRPSDPLTLPAARLRAGGSGAIPRLDRAPDQYGVYSGLLIRVRLAVGVHEPGRTLRRRPYSREPVLISACPIR